MNSRRVITLVLAAGQSTRMGFPKALCPFQGETFIERILRIHRVHSLPTIVLLGFDHQLILDAVPFEDVRVVLNPHPERGPLSSLQAGLDRARSFDGLLLHPVDHPCVKADTIGRLLETFERLPASILIPESAGRKGHPVLFPARFFSDLQEAPLDQGARSVTRQNQPNVHRVPVCDDGIWKNIDTPADLTCLTDWRPGIWVRP